MSSIDSKKMDIAIIVVSFNAERDFQELLPQLVRIGTEYPIEIIIVDNNSCDNTIGILKPFSNDIILIKNSTNKGFAAAVNQALNRMTSDYFLLLNPDARITLETVQALHEFLCDNPSAAAVAPRITFPDGSLQPSRGTFPNLLIVMAHLFRLKKLMPVDERVISGPFRCLGGLFKQYAVLEPIQKVDYTTGACVLFRSKPVQEIGGFDERFFLYYEEIDLAMRLKSAGYDWVFLNDLEITHEVAGASGKSPIRPFFERYRSMILFFGKHHSRICTKAVYNLVAVAVWLRILIHNVMPSQRIDSSVDWIEEKKMLKEIIRLRRDLHI
jgi:GT2 family glycosyltransferase